MYRFIPEMKSKKWFSFAIWLMLFCTATTIMVLYFFLKRTIGLGGVYEIMSLMGLFSLIVAVAGWLGRKFLCYFTLFGLLLGVGNFVIRGVQYADQGIMPEYLFQNIMMLGTVFFLGGIGIEILDWILGKLERRKKKPEAEASGNDNGPRVKKPSRKKKKK